MKFGSHNSANADNKEEMTMLARKLSVACSQASRGSHASNMWTWWRSRSTHTATVGKGPNSVGKKILVSSAGSEHAAPRTGPATNSVCLTSAFLTGSLDMQNLEYALPSLRSSSPSRCPPPPVTVPVPMTLIVPQKAEITAPAASEGSSVTIGEPAPPARAPMRCTNRLIRIRKRKMKVHHRKKRFKKNKASFRKMWAKREATAEVAFRVEQMGKVKVAERFDAQKYVDDSLAELHRELIPGTIDGKRRPQWLIKQMMEERDVARERQRRMRTDLITQEPLVREGETVEEFVKRMDAARRK